MSATNDPRPKRVYFRPPDDWDELTEAEQLAWAEKALELMIAQTNLEPRSAAGSFPPPMEPRP